MTGRVEAVIIDRHLDRGQFFDPLIELPRPGDSRSQGGTGLGLSLSYDIVVKGHGGKIEVDTREGEFTEFKITLPLAS